MRTSVECLRAAGRPAPGEEWTRDALRTVLANEHYTGDFSYGKNKSGKYNHATEEPIFIPDNHAVIIDRATFDAVQKRRERERGGKTPKRNGGNFVLSGLIRCSSCGDPIHGHCVKDHNYLVCGGYTRKGHAFCDRNSVREDEVLERIIEAIERVYLSPDLIHRVREELRRQVQDGCQGADVADLKKELAKNEKNIDTARSNMVLADPELLPEYEKVFRELRSRQTQLNSQIKAGQGQQERQADETVDRAVALLSPLRKTCRRANRAQLREFLKTAIDKVVIRVKKTRPGRIHRYHLLGGHLLGGDIHMQVYNLGLHNQLD